MHSKPNWLTQSPDQWPPSAKTVFGLLLTAAQRRLDSETSAPAVSHPPSPFDTDPHSAKPRHTRGEKGA